MENKQESSQQKVPSKSSKRRQRRREAAALHKLAASVISQKFESSVELPKKISDQAIEIRNEKSNSDHNLENQLKINNSTTESNLVSVKICEKNPIEEVADQKISKKSKSSNISSPLLGSNKKKNSTSDLACAKQNINNKEEKKILDIVKNEPYNSTNEPFPIGKASHSSQDTKKRKGKTQPQVSEIDLKVSSLVQESFCNCNIRLLETVKNSFNQCNELEKKDKTICAGHGEVKAKEKNLDETSKKKKKKAASKSNGSDESKKNVNSSLPKNNYKSGSICNVIEESRNSVSEAVNKSSSLIQQTDSSSGTPEFHLEITLKEQSVISEKLNKNLSDTSLSKEMDKNKKRVSDQKEGISNKTVNMKCAQNISVNIEEKSSGEAESKTDTIDREKVKAEREARKAAKLLKKQKDKVVKENGDAESSREESSQSKTNVKGDESVVESKNIGEDASKIDTSDKEKIKLEREARKAAKQVNKQKDKVMKENGVVECSGEESLKSSVKNDDFKQENETLTPISNQDKESNVNIKSKAELRAERRAKQEAQRAAKAAAAANTATPAPKKVSVPEIDKTLQSNKSKGLSSQKKSVKEAGKKEGAKLLNRFGLGESRSQHWKENSLLETQHIHPAVVQLGTRFTDRIISGSNARCIAFVQAIKKAIQDYETPPQKELARDLEACLLTPSLEYLEAQRPHAVSVSNATRFLKWQLTQLQTHHDSSSEKKVAVPDEKAKQSLIEGLDSYIWEKIEVAEKAVCLTLMDKIKNGDIILTYGCSYLLQQIFLEAKKAGTMFKVVVVDGRPWKEGREMLRSLVSAGIPCSYVLLSAASSVMRQVNKVILGAHALLSNGYVMSRVGVSQVALLASAHNVPVLVACETHKFCERVQSDSFVYNEMGEPDGLSQLLGGEEGPLSGWKNIPNLSLLNLSYDVTPPELVTAVATELAVLPCTSVPVVLRVRPMEPVTSRH